MNILLDITLKSIHFGRQKFKVTYLKTREHSTYCIPVFQFVTVDGNDNDDDNDDNCNCDDCYNDDCNVCNFACNKHSLL